MRKTKQLSIVLLLVVAWLMSNNLQAQDLKVTGNIKSSLDDKPVSDVKIRVLGEKEIGAVSDANGNYTITIGSKTSGQLNFIHPDFDALEMFVNGRDTINVYLQSSIRYDAYGQKVGRTPMTIETRSGTLVFETADQNFRTWFDLRVNFDGAHYFDKNALNPIGDGLTIRRLRFAMKKMVVLFLVLILVLVLIYSSSLMNILPESCQNLTITKLTWKKFITTKN